MPGLIRLDTEKNGRGSVVAISSRGVRESHKQRVGKGGLADNLQAERAFDGVTGHKGFKEGPTSRGQELAAEPLLTEVKPGRVGIMFHIVAPQVYFLLRVANFIEHLCQIALPQFLVVHRTNQHALTFTGGILGEGENGERRLERLGKPRLNLIGVIHTHGAVEEPILAVVFLGLHRHVITDQMAEWILGFFRNVKAGWVLDLWEAIGGFPLQTFDLFVCLNEIPWHSLSLLCVITSGSGDTSSILRTTCWPSCGRVLFQLEQLRVDPKLLFLHLRPTVIAAHHHQK